MYGEDHDLFWRAHESGGTTWFTTEAEFVHSGGGSTASAYPAPLRARKVAEAEAAVIRRHLGHKRAELTVGLSSNRPRRGCRDASRVRGRVLLAEYGGESRRH
jgi:hypothetical protein